MLVMLWNGGGRGANVGGAVVQVAMWHVVRPALVLTWKAAVSMLRTKLIALTTFKHLHKLNMDMPCRAR